MNLLLDTNIIVDYVGEREPFFGPAQKVIAAGFFGDATLWTSAQSLKDAYYILSNKTNQLHVQRALRQLLDIVSLVSLSAEDAKRGLYLEWDDYEDCIIALCASRAKADYIITRDKEGFTRSMVPAISPVAWATIMKEEHSLEYALAYFENDHPSSKFNTVSISIKYYK